MLHPNRKTICAVFFMGLLAGCDDEHSSDADSGNADLNNTVLSRAGISGSPLTYVSADTFESFLKNGIRLRATSGIFTPEIMETADESSSSESSGASSNFSTTNLHEAGVDEADRLKYDGQYLYTLNNDASSSPSIDSEDDETVSGIRILKTNINEANAHQVASIEVSSTDILSGLYLRSDQNQLLALANTTDNQYQYSTTTVPTQDEQNDTDTYYYADYRPSFALRSFDIKTPEQPAKQWELEFEGSLRNSRRIDDKLYLIMQYNPHIAGLINYATTDSEKADNERIITEASLSDLLPHYTDHNGDYKSLLTADNCLVSKDNTENQGYADLLTLVAIDLDNHEVSSAVCINTALEGIYSATDHLYLGASEMTNNAHSQGLTAIHKFALNDGMVNYQASTGLPGYLGWQDPSFRMHQFQDQLRVVTTEYSGDEGRPTHTLHTVQDDGRGKLASVSTLPNDDAPEAIGKPGEDIYSVRFTDTRAYITTFEQIDPLYVIDLTDSQQPRIAGQLEISGYSSYLHPISDDWLLGLGYEVIDDQQMGIKMVLFDIRDFENPSIRNQHIIGGAGSYSEALTDLRAFTFLDIDDTTSRIAIPIQKRNYTSASYSEENGLFGFELNRSSSGELDLSYSGNLITESYTSTENNSQKSSMMVNYPESRSVLHDDVVYYLSHDDIYSAIWGDWDKRQGPF